jgi:hypothetical protein
MNKITKILASLVASFAITFSANAGELTVSGTAKATYNTLSGKVTSDNSIGVANELTFKAGGDLDNGWTWNYKIALDPAGTAGGGAAINDDTALDITTPYGSVAMCGLDCGLSVAGDFNANAYAWITDTGYAEGKVEPVNISSYNNIQYHSPAGLLPFETVIKAAYAPSGSTVSNSANASGTAVITALGSTTMYKVETTPIDGLAVSASFAEQDGGNVTGLTDEQKSESGAVAAKYSMGSFTVGLGKAYIAPLLADGSTDRIESYENTNYSIAFAVNDQLSLSYSDETSEPDNTTAATVTYDQETKSMQAAYTMGGVTFALAYTDYENNAYVQNADVTEAMFAVTVAF